MNVDFSKLGILVVDDEFFIRNLVKSVLSDLNATKIFTAKNGAEALEVLEGAPDIDIIICDWMMPCVSGLELLQKVRSVDRNLPFLMLTALADVDAVMHAKAAGVTDYLVKPFSANDLKRKLHRLKPVTAAVRYGQWSSLV